MYKLSLLMDTDALIKLTKAGLMNKIGKEFACFITKEVYEEAVVEGKKLLYADADHIEKFIEQKLIVVRDKGSAIFSSSKMLGKGEASIAVLYQKNKNSVIVTDDNAFINILKERNIDAITPASLIILLKELKKINKSQSLQYIENLRQHINPKVYKAVKKKLEA